MDACTCGVALRRFWIWRDESQAPHASAFEPAITSEAEYLAASARDAMCVLLAQSLPTHDVRPTKGGDPVNGRCQNGR